MLALSLSLSCLPACSRTRSTHLHANKAMREAVRARAGKTFRFKWYAKPGDVKYSVWFTPGPSPPAGIPVHPSAAAIVDCPPPALSGNVIVKAAQHANCDKGFVEHEVVAPADGFFVLTWENNNAWAGRSREVFARCVAAKMSVLFCTVRRRQQRTYWGLYY